MGNYIGLIVRLLGVSPTLARLIAYASIVLAAVGAFFTAKALYDHAVVAKYKAKEEQRAAPATNKATNQRAADAEKRAEKTKEMNDVIASVPDQAINPVSHARACIQLQRAGRRPPPSCRPYPAR